MIPQQTEVKIEFYSGFIPMHEWLVNSIGQQGDKWNLIIRHITKYHQECFIVFKNEADAVAFKLMYG